MAVFRTLRVEPTHDREALLRSRSLPTPRAMTVHLDNLNIAEARAVPSPREIRDRLPQSDAAATTVAAGRAAVEAILDGLDKRVFVVVGPCYMFGYKCHL